MVNIPLGCNREEKILREIEASSLVVFLCESLLYGGIILVVKMIVKLFNKTKDE